MVETRARTHFTASLLNVQLEQNCMLLLIWPTSISSNLNWISQLARCSEVTLGLTQHVASLDSCSEWNDPVGPWPTKALIGLDASLFLIFFPKSGMRCRSGYHLAIENRWPSEHFPIFSPPNSGARSAREGGWVFFKLFHKRMMAGWHTAVLNNHH